MDLKNRVVLITGAGRGIGRALARAFAAEGAHVALMGRTKKNLVEVQKELKAFGVKTAVLPGDVADEGTVSRCVAAAEQALGPVDVLVNNAGIYASAPVDHLDALVGLSEAMRYDARIHDVRVTTVFPSTVATDLVRESGLNFDPARAILPDDIANTVVSLVKMEDRALPTSVEIWQTNP
jgi:3-oxoacyl-[acyl-carrier protein] reductase